MNIQNKSETGQNTPQAARTAASVSHRRCAAIAVRTHHGLYCSTAYHRPLQKILILGPPGCSASQNRIQGPPEIYPAHLSHKRTVSFLPGQHPQPLGSQQRRLQRRQGCGRTRARLPLPRRLRTRSGRPFAPAAATEGSGEGVFFRKLDLQRSERRIKSLAAFSLAKVQPTPTVASSQDRGRGSSPDPPR